MPHHELGVMPQSRYRSGGFTPPFSGWRGKPGATFEIETEALQLGKAHACAD